MLRVKIVNERRIGCLRVRLLAGVPQTSTPAGFGYGSLAGGTTRGRLGDGKMTSRASRPDFVSRRSYHPRSSVSERTPSSAMLRANFFGEEGRSGNRRRPFRACPFEAGRGARFRSCVAMPTGQVLRWHWRAITQTDGDEGPRCRSRIRRRREWLQSECPRCEAEAAVHAE